MFDISVTYPLHIPIQHMLASHPLYTAAVHLTLP